MRSRHSWRQEGDRVVIYLPMGVEGVVAMQACARIGAIHSVVFGGFSAQSLRDRINDAGAVAVITSPASSRGGKALPLKTICDEAFASVAARVGQGRHRLQAYWRRVQHGRRPRHLVGRRHRRPVGNLRAGVGRNRASAVPPLHLGFDGKPKGVQHSTGGYLLHAILTMKWTFDLKKRRLLVPLTSAGSRAYLHHLRPAGLRRLRIVFEACRPIRTPAASGR